MSVENGQSNYLQRLFGKFLDYLKSRAELAYITAIEKASRLLAFFISSFIVFLFFILFVVFLSIFIGFWLGAALESNLAGFGIVAIAYFLIFILLWTLKKPLILRPLANGIIRILYENIKNDNHNDRD